MQQIWNDLLFAHWPIAPEIMCPLVPSALPLDTFNGQCWIAVTPFHMSGIRPHWMPPLPGLSTFPELNVRTYVTHGGKGGVYFFSLDAGSRLAALAARATYHLPYFHAQMKVVDHNGWIEYHCTRNPGAQLHGKYRPTSPVQIRDRGTLAHWLTERYCLYTVHRDRVYRAEIHHEPWPLQDAECEFSVNSMATSRRHPVAQNSATAALCRAAGGADLAAEKSLTTRIIRLLNLHNPAHEFYCVQFCLPICCEIGDG